MKTTSKNKLTALPIGGKIFTYAIYIVAALFVLLPIYVMAITSVTSYGEAMSAGFHWLPQKGFTLDAYEYIATTEIVEVPLIRNVLNSLILYIPSTTVGCIISAISAFAFAKLEFRLKGFMFSVLITTMTLPNIMGQTASYLMYEKMNWIDTILPLTVPRMFGSIATVFFLRQFIMGIPGDLMGAARIDGLGEFGICLRLILPISLPAIFARFVLEFSGAYNEYMSVLLYLPNRQDLATIALALTFYKQPYVQNWPVLMGCCVISIVPLLLLYLLAQRYILLGMEFSASLKG